MDCDSCNAGSNASRRIATCWRSSGALSRSPRGEGPRLLDIHAHQCDPRVCTRSAYRVHTAHTAAGASEPLRLFGVFFRLNLPVLFATVFVSNPFTWVPQVAGSIWVGAKLHGHGSACPLAHQISHRNHRTQLGHLGRRCCSARWCSARRGRHSATCCAGSVARPRGLCTCARRRARSDGRGAALEQNPVASVRDPIEARRQTLIVGHDHEAGAELAVELRA